MSGFFVCKTRDNGETFYCLTDDAPSWVRDVVQEAHDGELPNDWRFNILDGLFGEIDADTDEDRLPEIVDGLVDVYNGPRALWLADNVSRSAYVDAAREDYGATGDVFDMIGVGQYVAIESMARLVFDAIGENVSEHDMEEDEDGRDEDGRDWRV